MSRDVVPFVAVEPEVLLRHLAVLQRRLPQVPRHGAGDQDVDDDAQRPHVHGGSVRFLLDNLGRRVHGRAHRGVVHALGVREVLAVLDQSGATRGLLPAPLRQAKVRDDHGRQVVLLLQQKILELQVAVNDEVRVHVVDALERLPDHHLGLRLGVSLVLHLQDGVQHRSSVQNLGDDVHVVLSLCHVVLLEVEDGRVVELAEGLDLGHDLLDCHDLLRALIVGLAMVGLRGSNRGGTPVSGHRARRVNQRTAVRGEVRVDGRKRWRFDARSAASRR